MQTSTNWYQNNQIQIHCSTPTLPRFDHSSWCECEISPLSRCQISPACPSATSCLPRWNWRRRRRLSGPTSPSTSPLPHSTTSPTVSSGNFRCVTLTLWLIRNSECFCRPAQTVFILLLPIGNWRGESRPLFFPYNPCGPQQRNWFYFSFQLHSWIHFW